MVGLVAAAVTENLHSWSVFAHTCDLCGVSWLSMRVLLSWKMRSFVSGTEYTQDVLVLVKKRLEEGGRSLKILADKLSSPLVVTSQGSRSIELAGVAQLPSPLYCNKEYLLPSA